MVPSPESCDDSPLGNGARSGPWHLSWPLPCSLASWGCSEQTGTGKARNAVTCFVYGNQGRVPGLKMREGLSGSSHLPHLVSRTGCVTVFECCRRGWPWVLWVIPITSGHRASFFFFFLSTAILMGMRLTQSNWMPTWI